MDMNLLLICPTRGRLERCRKMVESFVATKPTRSHLLLATDLDDPVFYSQLEGGRVLHVSTPRMRLAGSLNYHAQIISASAYAMLNDDVVFRTPDWEAKVEAAFQRGAVVVYGDDGLNGEKLCCFPFVDARAVKAVGHFAPPGLVHLCIDNYWLDVGTALGRIKYLPDVVIEHEHPIAKKAEWDDGYAEANLSPQAQRDLLVYRHYRQHSLPGDVQKIAEALR